MGNEKKSKVFIIEKFFQSEDTLNKVLDYCNQFFVRIDEIQKVFRVRKTINPQEILEATIKINGYYGALNPILAIAETEKKNRELRYYGLKKNEIEDKGIKFISASVEKESSSHVANYRKVRNLIKNYVEVCKTTISLGQSIMKELRSEQIGVSTTENDIEE